MDKVMKLKTTEPDNYEKIRTYDNFPLVNIERNNGECILHISPSSINFRKEDSTENINNQRTLYSEEIWKNMSFWQKLGFYCFLYDIPESMEVGTNEKKEITIEDKIQDNSTNEPLEKKVEGIRESFRGYNGFRIELNENNKYDVFATKE
jgi:hypothetical protein